MDPCSKARTALVVRDRRDGLQSDERVRVETQGDVLTITLVDAANRNALGAALVAGIARAIDHANEQDSIRAVVLTNEGSTFCAGANLKEQAARNASGESTALDGFPALLSRIRASATPVLARIDGHVVGGGMGLAAVCDVAIAREDVSFGFSEVRLGVTPAIVSVVCLPKMRPGEAMEAFLRGNRFPATRAADYGLIHRAVPGAALDPAIDEVVADLRKGGPVAIGLAKQLVHDVPGRPFDEALAWAGAFSAECFASEEAARGMRAFLEKRDPDWISHDREA